MHGEERGGGADYGDRLLITPPFSSQRAPYKLQPMARVTPILATHPTRPNDINLVLENLERTLSLSTPLVVAK